MRRRAANVDQLTTLAEDDEPDQVRFPWRTDTVPIVLDTASSTEPKRENLAQVPDDVIVPAVVFTERARQLAERGIIPDDFRERLAANEFAIEADGEEHAARFAPTIHDDEDWHRLARDAMIAGHVDPSSVLWTTDPSSFREPGLADERIVAV